MEDQRPVARDREGAKSVIVELVLKPTHFECMKSFLCQISIGWYVVFVFTLQAQ